MKKTTFIFLMGILLMGFSTTALGDVLVLKSGKIYEGKILSDEEDTVIFEAYK